MAFVAKGINVDTQALPANTQDMSTFQQLIIAGMLLAHTPSDSEVFVQPAFIHKPSIVNPYYDIDLIEFMMSVPLRYRLKIAPFAKLPFRFEKTILQAVAAEWLPPAITQRKKALTVSFDRDEASRKLLSQLPHEMEGIPLNTLDQRFAAYTLQAWLAHYHLGQLLTD